MLNFGRIETQGNIMNILQKITNRVLMTFWLVYVPGAELGATPDATLESSRIHNATKTHGPGFL
jgi:hypothetical protein